MTIPDRLTVDNHLYVHACPEEAMTDKEAVDVLAEALTVIEGARVNSVRSEAAFIVGPDGRGSATGGNIDIAPAAPDAEVTYCDACGRRIQRVYGVEAGGWLFLFGRRCHERLQQAMGRTGRCRPR